MAVRLASSVLIQKSYYLAHLLIKEFLEAQPRD